MTNLLVILFSSKNLKIKKYKTQETQIGNFLLYKNNINEYCIIGCAEASFVIIFVSRPFLLRSYDKNDTLCIIMIRRCCIFVNEIS